MGNAREKKLFLKSLAEDGIEEIYMPKKSAVSVKSLPSTKPDAGDIQSELLKLQKKTAACKLCGELASTRKNVVFGSGNSRAELMFVGEAPGRDEDIQGLPFVGRAGQLLTKIIEAMGYSRDKVFIANVLKCRPPENRAPKPDEVINCEPFLNRQIELIRPKIICALGTHAAQALLKTGEPISKLRGHFIPLPHNAAIQVMCTFHPAYLLRNPPEKKKVWDDMKLVMAELKK